MKKNTFAKMIDHTLLKANAKVEDIEKLCSEAKEYGFHSVCVNPFWVSYCHSKLHLSPVKVCSVVDFPLGASTIPVKKFEAEEAVRNGADEIDYVVSIESILEERWDYLEREALEIKEVAQNIIVKAIIECYYLEPKQIKQASSILDAASIDFVKTSSGYAPGGAKKEDVALMRSAVNYAKIKASGAIGSLADAKTMIEAGAERLGLSRSLDIMSELEND